MIQKFKEIIRIQVENTSEQIGEFNNPITENEIIEIENIIEEQLPEEFKRLYLFANGQKDDGNGLLLGERFMTSNEIIRQLEFSKSLVKPKIKTIENPELSEKLIKKIVEYYLSKAPKNKFLKKTWYKMEFACSANSFEGPYLYANKNTDSRKRTVLDMEYDNIGEVIRELHELERKTYNWDELKFVVYQDGKFEVERTFYNFDDEISFTSIPENAIKKKYFNYKWVPIFSDYGGNFIGIDLDPDVNGKKGQIIVFGRDESEMFVIANDLNSFFEFILNQIEKGNRELLDRESHLHDELKKVIQKRN